MYAWIWRKLPFGLPGKLIGSLLLVSAVVALLWYVVFPAADPLLPPYDDVQVTNDDGGAPGDGGAPEDEPLPYSTVQNNPPPSPTGRR